MTACKSNVKNVGTAMKMYATDNDQCFPSRLDDLMPKYLNAIPTCPSAGRVTYVSATYHKGKDNAYTVVCEGHNHENVGLPASYPQYTSTQGLIDR